VHSAPWRGEMQNVLERHGWRTLSFGAYDIWVKSGRNAATMGRTTGKPSQVPNLAG